MGVTPQRHDMISIVLPERGLNQMRLLEEIRAQQVRDDSLQNLEPPILQVLLLQENTCDFKELMITRLNPTGNIRLLLSRYTITIP